MEMDIVVKRKIIKLAKPSAPVLLLMGLLIAVDSLDSVQGARFLRKMKRSLDFTAQHHNHHHLELRPPHTFISSSIKTINDIVNVELISKNEIARPLLQVWPSGPQLVSEPTPVTVAHLKRT